jgi:hypothetical protein
LRCPPRDSLEEDDEDDASSPELLAPELSDAADEVDEDAESEEELLGERVADASPRRPRLTELVPLIRLLEAREVPRGRVPASVLASSACESAALPPASAPVSGCSPLEGLLLLRSLRAALSLSSPDERALSPRCGRR